ncbi:MAG: outer membrane protein assembly factor BamD [Terriglobales bacterium]
MLRRILPVVLLAVAVLTTASCHRNKTQNPLANIDSKQPDKVLYDRAMAALKKNRYDVARITLQTLINTYPDSEYIARAKLSVGDAWYAEGGSSGLAQAEIEYKDFITFFPNLPEAAEAQLKVSNIHYKQMEKPDRDFTHAKRAEDEYKQLLLQFPDSKLVPEARQRLLQVQEVLAEREFRIGHFYFVRESWAAAIARLKTLTDTYPLYSEVDEALYMLGQAYERQMDTARATKLNETAKGELLRKFTDAATEAYSRILTRYPAMERAEDAKLRLEALHQPIPTPTEAAIAQNRAEEASRGETGMRRRLFMNLRRGPDVARAAKVGEPTMTEPKPTGAPDIVREAGKTIEAAYSEGGSHTLAVETVGTGEPPKSDPTPRSAQPATADDQQGPPPTQVNEAAVEGQSDQAAAASADPNAKDDKDDKKQTSSSRKKKKKGLRKIIPF